MSNLPDRDKLVSVVVPCYNEATVVARFHDAITGIFKELPNYHFEIIFIDDGSSDDTVDKILSLQVPLKNIRLIELSRNFGKEAALTAGIYAAKGDAVIPIDVDLQDPPGLIPSMIEKWEAGADVVLARRADRKADSMPKRLSSKAFYSVHSSLSKVNLPSNVGDFRLMDRKVVDAINRLPERQRFMKGIFSWVGFESVVVDYTREERAAGETKFSAWKLWNLALEGITGFSTVPLRVSTYIGLLGAFLSVIYVLIILGQKAFYGISVPGYASLMIVVLLFGSVQLIFLGIIGEYIGRTYIEVKQRPLYIVKKLHEDKE